MPATFAPSGSVRTHILIPQHPGPAAIRQVRWTDRPDRPDRRTYPISRCVRPGYGEDPDPAQVELPDAPTVDKPIVTNWSTKRDESIPRVI
ncbi:hypothetical protein ACH4TY_07785 [Streptomyces anulatus]